MRRRVGEWFGILADIVRSLHPTDIVLIVAIAATGVFIIISSVNPPTHKSPTLTLPEVSQPPDDSQPSTTNIVSFTNDAAGYGFRYPTAWSIAERGAATELTSPNGRILLSFGVSSSDALALAARRVERANFAAVEPIGTSREHIDGARAFLSAGLTQTRAGRAIRFLAIAVDGDRGAYTISVATPAHVDPGRVLPQVERIISSFQTGPRYVA